MQNNDDFDTLEELMEYFLIQKFEERLSKNEDGELPVQRY